MNPATLPSFVATLAWGASSLLALPVSPALAIACAVIQGACFTMLLAILRDTQ